MKYRKKPIAIEAKQLTERSLSEILNWVKDGGFEAETKSDDTVLFIKTLEGVMCANKNDWIIRGVNGEFYPCKPDIFEATYEKVHEE